MRPAWLHPLGAAALLAVPLACTVDLDLDPEVVVSCADDNECGEGLACIFVGNEGHCGSEASACVDWVAGRAVAADDGNGCTTSSGEGGICLRGECGVSRCGDGYRDEESGELCDDGGDNSDAWTARAHCNETCSGLGPFCGDGVAQAEETCDDGGAARIDWQATPGCLPSCDGLAPHCGDGVVDVGHESCDDAGESATCNSDCSAASCGDGIYNAAAGEQCDDGAETRTCSTECVATSAQLELGADFSCVRWANGEVACWGYNAFGQLGRGDSIWIGDNAGEMGSALVPVDLPGRAIDLAAGASHVCAILDDDSVRCWGDNQWAQLGLGDGENRGDDAGEMGSALPAVDLVLDGPPVAVGAGASHSCVLTSTGRVTCWGSNYDGQLGLEDTDVRGDLATDMGANLPAVDLGSGRTATQLAVGTNNVCVVTDDDQVRCWGNNGIGILADGTRLSRGDDAGEMGDALPAIDLGAGRTPVQLVVRGDRVCTLLADATVTCWGSNNGGALGQGRPQGEHFGDDAAEQVATLPPIELGTFPVAEVAVGSSHVCARSTGGEVKCWGGNTYGELGLGDAIGRGETVVDMGSNLPVVDLGANRTVLSIAAASNHTCAVLDDLSIKCWGRNFHGQLGLGDNANRGDDAGEMGNALPTVSF